MRYVQKKINYLNYGSIHFFRLFLLPLLIAICYTYILHWCRWLDGIREYVNTWMAYIDCIVREKWLHVAATAMCIMHAYNCMKLVLTVSFVPDAFFVFFYCCSIWLKLATFCSRLRVITGGTLSQSRAHSSSRHNPNPTSTPTPSSAPIRSIASR